MISLICGILKKKTQLEVIEKGIRFVVTRGGGKLEEGGKRYKLPVMR